MCKNPPLFAMGMGIGTEEWHFFTIVIRMSCGAWPASIP